jgi:tetratricopeptide (TPR) repeat protein
VTREPPDRDVPETPLAGVGTEGELWGLILAARDLTERGELGRAEEVLDEASGLLADDTPDAFLTAYFAERLRVAAGLGDITRALDYAAESIQAASRSSAVHANAAMLFRELGDLDEAIDALYTALEMDREFRYFAALVSLLREAGRREEALRVCDRMVEFHPDLADAYALRGITRFMIATDVPPLDPAAVPRLRAQLTDDLGAALRCGATDLDQTRALRACLRCL